MKKILVVGSVNMDFTVYTDVVPRGGQTVHRTLCRFALV